MHYQEITNKEASNIGEINLYLEGVFGKAYQQSAYLFVKNVADFKLSGKFIKAISQPVVFIGFPKSSLIKLFDKNHIEKIDEKSICIKGYKLDLSQYNEWFEKRPVLKEKNNKEVYFRNSYEGLKNFQRSVICKFSSPPYYIMRKSEREN